MSVLEIVVRGIALFMAAFGALFAADIVRNAEDMFDAVAAIVLALIAAILFAFGLGAFGVTG